MSLHIPVHLSPAQRLLLEKTLSDLPMPQEDPPSLDSEIEPLRGKSIFLGIYRGVAVGART